MTDNTIYMLAVFAAMAAVSFAERALPFAASSWLRKQKWVRSLGDFLPLAIMVLLTVHAAAGTPISRGELPWAEVCGIAIAFGLQGFLKNALLSIFGGTIVYVAWVNDLFGLM